MNTGYSLAEGGVAALARFYERCVHLGLHVHGEAQLLFASRGVMQVTTPKGRWLVPPRRAVWLPPRLEHAVDMLTDLEMRSLYIAPAWLASHPELPRLGREFVVAVGTLLRELVLAMFAVGADPRRIDLLARLALFELADAEDAATFMPMPSDPRARRVAEQVLAEPASVRDLDDLARAAGASQRTVTRLFPAETDLTFKEWRQRARILASVEMLDSGRTSVSVVASRLGFSSAAAFGHAFRQVLGIPPGEFMNRPERVCNPGGPFTGGRVLVIAASDDGITSQFTDSGPEIQPRPIRIPIAPWPGMSCRDLQQPLPTPAQEYNDTPWCPMRERARYRPMPP